MGSTIRNRLAKHQPWRNRRLLRCESLEGRRLLAASLGFGSGGEGEDQTFVVTTIDDELDANPANNLADLSLREAILLANTTSGRDSISFASGLSGTIELDVALGQLVIEDPVDVIGPGADLITIDALNNSRVLQLSETAGDVLVQGLTLTGGRTTSDLSGGAGIRSLSTGTLTIQDVNITGNATFGQGSAGAGVLSGFSISNPNNPGNLTVIDSVISGNQTNNIFSGGGGIFSGGGVLSITGSTISDNKTVAESSIGGGVYTSTTDVTITASTISGNSTEGTGSGGGGLAIQSSSLTILSSTISGNTTTESSSRGGGIFARRTDVTLTNSTLSGNTATLSTGGGIYASRGNVGINHSTVSGNQSGISGGGFAVSPTGSQVSLTVEHSIIAGNTSSTGTAPDLLAGDALVGSNAVMFSLIGSNSGTALNESQSIDPTTGNLVGDPDGAGLIDPQLGPLAGNGGPTQTHALQVGSPAIDAGDAAFQVTPELQFDQRGDGFPRIDNDRIDLGAFERSDVVTPSDLDFGDAADDYPVLLADNGARHVISTLTLGSQVDAESDGQVSANASGDGADDDGVLPLSDFVAVASVSTTAAYVVTASQTGRLDGWIDFNRDGDWTDPGEQIFVNRSVAAGSNTLPFTVPAGSSPGTTFARFRISTAGGLSPTGEAIDGEVEDYQVTLLNGSATPAVSSAFSGHDTSLAIESGEAVIRIGATVVFRAPLTSMGSLALQGSDEDLTFTINAGGGFSLPSGGINLDGGSGVNTLAVTGNGGAIDFTSASVNVTGFGTLDLSSPDLNTVTIDAATIASWLPVTKKLSVILAESSPAQEDISPFDTLIVSDKFDWLMTDPITRDGRFILTAQNTLGGGESIEVDKPAVWQNILQVGDVSNNGTVSAQDALQIINELARLSYSEAGTGILVDPLTIDDFPGKYYDQNGDGRVSALDALRVINQLAREANGGGSGNELIESGEGESMSPPTQSPSSVSADEDDEDARVVDLAINQLF